MGAAAVDGDRIAPPAEIVHAAAARLIEQLFGS
jgi:hypothetical protein